MNRNQHLVVLLVLLSLSLVAIPAAVASGKARAVRESVEWILRQPVSDGGQAGLSAHRADMHRLLTRSLEEEGPDTLEAVRQVVARHGTVALGGLAADPATYGKLVARLPLDEQRGALHLLTHHADRLEPFINRHGMEALRAEMRYPGIGAAALDRAGGGGWAALERLFSTEAAGIATATTTSGTTAQWFWQGAKEGAALLEHRGLRHTVLGLTGIGAATTVGLRALEPTTYHEDGMPASRGAVAIVMEPAMKEVGRGLSVGVALLFVTLAAMLWMRWPWREPRRFLPRHTPVSVPHRPGNTPPSSPMD